MGFSRIPFESPDTDFPKNKIVLLNGNELHCYPKPNQPELLTKDDLKLDTTGVYFSLKRNSKSPDKKKEESAKKELLEQFFLNHAFYFLEHADKVFNDSRMFLAHVPVVSGIAYTGTSGFTDPTLGIYLEWWLNCEADVRHDSNGNDALTYHIAGSPLSGCNKCACVYSDGSTKSISHHSFLPVWSSFIDLNWRYTEAKYIYESYSLQEVYDILVATDESEERELAVKLKIQDERHGMLTEMYHSLCAKMRALAMRFHNSELADFTAELQKRKEDTKKALANLEIERKELRKQWENGEIPQPEYSRKVNPLRLQEKDLEKKLEQFKYDSIQQLLSSGDLTIGMVIDYLKD